jgi:hypothetical protein
MKTFEEYTEHHNLKIGDYVRLNPLTMHKYFYNKYKNEIFVIRGFQDNSCVLDYTSNVNNDITGKWFGNIQYDKLIKLDDYELSALKYNL